MKTMFSILLLGAVIQAAPANAAQFACSYQEEACNDRGDHYYCYGYGWVGPGMEFCSATDRTSHLLRKPLSVYGSGPSAETSPAENPGEGSLNEIE